MIQFKHTYKTYPGDVCALRDINLNISKGEFVFLTGPSGAGKTTLFKMISAFDQPSSGVVQVAGFNLNELSSHEIPYFRRQIGVVYQDFRLLKNRTVFENIALPLEVRGDKPATIQSRVMDMIDRVSLTFKAKSYPPQLSGGEQQRVAIARALVHQPGVLIADEPTGNLDPDLSKEILDLLDQANAQGTTVFVATHDHELVRERNRSRVIIEAGEIKESIQC